MVSKYGLLGKGKVSLVSLNLLARYLLLRSDQFLPSSSASLPGLVKHDEMTKVCSHSKTHASSLILAVRIIRFSQDKHDEVE